MTEVSRRTVLAGLAAAGAGLGGSAAAAAPATPLVTSDIGRLKRVLVHSLVPGDLGFDRLSADVLPSADNDVAAAAQQQQGLMALLRAQGAETVELADALQSAIEATRGSGVFANWVETAFPLLAADPAQVNAATILGRDPATQWRLDGDGNFRHLTDDSVSTIWTRDSAFMTPNGLVMCRSVSTRRRRENMLLRFCYAHSPLLDDYPIVFDAVEEGIGLEGGDAMVVDKGTLYLGVGNRSDPRIAPILARRLNMDVLAVQTVKQDYIRPARPGLQLPVAELKILLLHLDTYFTHVAPNHALCVPYLLEAAYADDNPLSRFVRGARSQTMLDPDDADKALTMLREFGKVTLYAAGTGKADTLGNMKLVDYLKTRGYRFTFVGGARPAGDQDAFRHFMTVAYPELRRQASNVVQAQPGRVIAYAGNPATAAALAADGIKVDSFGARDLWQWHGGPHCLTQPLERG
jgi:arginine deiminase